jgi:3-deoxy-D-manno-oct-2-ulosonic acid (Kdo) hydroxylase
MSSASSAASDSQSGMSRLVTANVGEGEQHTRGYCSALEAGDILFFSQTPFEFPEDDVQFLLTRKQAGGAFHKNIAYRPAADRITGADDSGPEAERLREIMRNYSRRSAEFLGGFLSPYGKRWKLDFASYRPLEERGRSARVRARNDLPHVDAFPTRPTNGDRILRFFSNINPSQNRVWITSQTFDVQAPRFVRQVGLPGKESNDLFGRAFRSVGKTLRLPGANRSPYDEFMHRCHNAMKEDEDFQRTCPKQRWEFPPNSAWMVYTDFVSHAVLEGQYALEQTFIVSRDAMVRPELAPVSILERIAGYTLTRSN